MRFILSVVACVHLIELACSQFPPIPENVTSVQSKFHNGISISYKEVQCDVHRMAAETFAALANILCYSLVFVRLPQE